MCVCCVIFFSLKWRAARRTTSIRISIIISVTRISKDVFSTTLAAPRNDFAREPARCLTVTVSSSREAVLVLGLISFCLQK